VTARQASSVPGAASSSDPAPDEAPLVTTPVPADQLATAMTGLERRAQPPKRVVVVGGGGMDAGDLLLGPARSAYRVAVEAPGSRPDVPLRPAELGADAGGIGAALLALEDAGVERIMLQHLAHDDLDMVTLLGAEVLPRVRRG